MSHNSEQEKEKSIGEHLNHIDKKVLGWSALTGGDLSERRFSRSPPVPPSTTNLNSPVQEEPANRIYELFCNPEMERVFQTRYHKLSEARYGNGFQMVESNVCDELRRQGVQFEMRRDQSHIRNEYPKKSAARKGKLSDQELAFEGWQHSLPLFQFGAAISKRIYWHHLLVEKGIVQRDEDIIKSAYKATKKEYVEHGFMAEDDPVPGHSWGTRDGRGRKDTTVVSLASSKVYRTRFSFGTFLIQSRSLEPLLLRRRRKRKT